MAVSKQPVATRWRPAPAGRRSPVSVHDQRVVPAGKSYHRRMSRARQRGQAMLETLIAIIFLCMIFFIMLEISQMFAAKEVIDHAANAGARSKAVGFNDFMVYKAVKVATIPTAGPMRNPDEREATPVWDWPRSTVGQIIDAGIAARPTSRVYPIESARIPLYLGAERLGELSGVLNYEHWDSVRWPTAVTSYGNSVNVRTRQEYPLRFPFRRLIYGDDEIRLRGSATHADHYSLYLE